MGVAFAALSKRILEIQNAKVLQQKLCNSIPEI